MNTLEQAKKLVENYCKYYGIKTNELKRNSRTYPHKVIIITKDKHVNTATMRMALGYFIFMHFPIRIKEVADIIGYQDHSCISTQRKRIDNYIETKDSYFMPYYEVLINLAKELDISIKYKRIYTNVANFIRYESDIEFAEQIKYYENA